MKRIIGFGMALCFLCSALLVTGLAAGCGSAEEKAKIDEVIQQNPRDPALDSIVGKKRQEKEDTETEVQQQEGAGGAQQ
ncbi:MAG: hypothetical protein HY706_17505 [Candidatus Hydrogenedentes bacterium]|nr:hypothetical protein [Candidatus Hydrogenedentota bacterium]